MDAQNLPVPKLIHIIDCGPPDCLPVFQISHAIVGISVLTLPSLLWHCWLGIRKIIRPVKKIEWWDDGVGVCLERGANDLRDVQLMPLPPPHLLLNQNPDWFNLSGAGLSRLS